MELGLDYAPNQGQTMLREHVAALDRAHPYESGNHGAQEALFLFYGAFLRPGDHVVTTLPGWQQAWEIPRWIGAEVTCLELERKHGYEFDLEQLKKCLKNNTRLLILNFPNSPWAGIYLKMHGKDWPDSPKAIPFGY